MTEFLDARTDDIPEEIDASVCVVGSGAAGITLARTLSKKLGDVVLIEAGGLRIDGATQQLFSGKQLGLPYYNLLTCRLRYFGGTTNHWSGYCRANDPIDYEGRPELGLPRWPVGHTDLEPYIKAAGDLLKIEALHFQPEAALAARGLEADELAEASSDVLLTKNFLFGRSIRIGDRNRDAIAADPNIRPVTYLNLTHIQLTPDGRSVDYLICKTLTQKAVIVRARKYALCCHGIENARLLLDSNDVQPDGIANASDHVGRYFMDHTHIHASRFVPTRAFPALYNSRYAGNYRLNANLSFTDAATRELGLLQYYCRFNPVYYSEQTTNALRNLRSNAMEPGDIDFLRDVATVTGEISGVSKDILLRLGLRRPLPDYFEMEHRLEQAPNPDSRVVLSERRDPLGSRIADLDWRINDHDVDSFRRGQEIMGRELSAMGWGRMIEEDITRELVEQRIAGHYHHIGTTRMSETAAEGVVDANCKVHGVDNLYVGGSSIFPTAGYSGPTMMIMAFAIRLADHLAQELA